MNLQMNLQKSKAYFLPALVVVVFFLWTVPLYAQEECPDELPEDRADLEKALEICEREILEEQKRLDGQVVERTETEKAILILDVEINKALVQLRTNDLQIHKISQEIGDKESAIAELEVRIGNHKNLLSDLLQRINESEQRGFLSFLLSDGTLSSFFAFNNDHDSVRVAVEDSIGNIQVLQERLDSGIKDLSEKQLQKQQIRIGQRATVNNIETQKGQKNELLSYQKKIEQNLEQSVSLRKQRVAQIENRLFELRGGGAISFKDALQFARNAEQFTGVRAAFILGLLKHESNLGKNVGRGEWDVDSHPTRDRPIFPFITRELGFEPDELRVSADPGYGWGGAMGPAQFIPSTWVCYGGFIQTRTKTCSIQASSYIIRGSSNLKIGSTGSDVKRLQKFLNKRGFTIATSGPGSPGKETSRYGPATAHAVSRFQEANRKSVLEPYNLSRGTGEVGPSTRRAVNQLNFYEGPWEYVASKDKIRNITGSDRPSNPWNPLDAFTTAAVFLKELGAVRDECTASRRYYAGGAWRSAVARNYCTAVLANARVFEQDIAFLNG